MKKERVFITSFGMVTACGSSASETFDSVYAGRSAIGPVSRFSTERLRTGCAAAIDLPQLLETIPADGVIHPCLSEPVLFSDNPRFAMALTAAIQALGLSSPFPENQPLLPCPLPGMPAWVRDCALFTTAGLEEVKLDQLSRLSGQEKDLSQIHLCPEVPPAFLGNILADLLSLNGAPPLSCVSACASGTQSIGEAFRAVGSGDLSIALAGGTDTMIYPYGINAFNSLGALAEGEDAEQSLRPFCRGRRGTLLGEGAAYVLLESEKNLEATGHRPLAEITGYASTLDGYHHVKPHPQGLGAIEAITAAMADAHRHPNQIGYINAHGSGTPQNDSVEAMVINTLFTQDKPLVSSTKAIHGHALTASGAIELILSLEALLRGQAPPAPGADQDMQTENLNLARQGNDHFSRTTVISNSFGLNGQNGVIVLDGITTSEWKS